MNKKILERYKGDWVSIGMPHYYKQGVLFYQAGTLTELYDNELVLTKRNGDEILIGYDRIREFKASGCGSNGY